VFVKSAGNLVIANGKPATHVVRTIVARRTRSH
jgi:hypothetical protein